MWRNRNTKRYLKREDRSNSGRQIPEPICSRKSPNIKNYAKGNLKALLRHTAKRLMAPFPSIATTIESSEEGNGLYGFLWASDIQYN